MKVLKRSATLSVSYLYAESASVAAVMHINARKAVSFCASIMGSPRKKTSRKAVMARSMSACMVLPSLNLLLARIGLIRDLQRTEVGALGDDCSTRISRTRLRKLRAQRRQQGLGSEIRR